jgi:hypothetical protein
VLETRKASESNNCELLVDRENRPISHMAGRESVNTFISIVEEKLIIITEPSTNGGFERHKKCRLS